MEYTNNVLLCASIGCGRLAELNVRRGGATGRVEIRRNKEVMAVLSAQGERLSQAYYVYPNTAARSPTHCWHDKKKYKIFLNFMCKLTLSILHEKHMSRSIMCVVCCLSRCTVFFRDYKKKKFCFILYNFTQKHFPF